MSYLWILWSSDSCPHSSTTVMLTLSTKSSPASMYLQCKCTKISLGQERGRGPAVRNEAPSIPHSFTLSNSCLDLVNSRTRQHRVIDGHRHCSIYGIYYYDSMSIHDPTLYVGFPTPLLAGHIRTHSVETAVVLAPASPTCPSVTMTRLPQAPGQGKKS